MKVKYVGDYYRVMFDKEKTYDVVAIEDGLLRVYSDEFEDDGLFLPEEFEVVEDNPEIGMRKAV